MGKDNTGLSTPGRPDNKGSSEDTPVVDPQPNPLKTAAEKSANEAHKQKASDRQGALVKKAAAKKAAAGRKYMVRNNKNQSVTVHFKGKVVAFEPMQEKQLSGTEVESPEFARMKSYFAIKEIK